MDRGGGGAIHRRREPSNVFLKKQSFPQFLGGFWKSFSTPTWTTRFVLLIVISFIWWRDQSNITEAIQYATAITSFSNFLEFVSTLPILSKHLQIKSTFSFFKTLLYLIIFPSIGAIHPSFSSPLQRSYLSQASQAAFV